MIRTIPKMVNRCLAHSKCGIDSGIDKYINNKNEKTWNRLKHVCKHVCKACTHSKLKVTQSCRLFATPWTIQSLEFSRPEYWSGQLFPSPRDLPKPGTEPKSLALRADSLLAETQGKAKNTGVDSLSLLQQIFPTQESNQGLLQCRRILLSIDLSGKPKWKSLSHVWLFAVPWTIQSMKYSRPNDWSGYSSLSGIFPTQGLNPGLPHCRRILYQLSHKGSP